ncbi:TPA: immunity 49 family protein [Vibrio vulnificus]|nr:immunity 49 family protein [Vibrio vulnificus]
MIILTRKADPSFETIPLDEQLSGGYNTLDKRIRRISIRRENLTSIPDQLIFHARWQTWLEQTPEVEKLSTLCFVEAAAMRAAYFKLAQPPEVEQAISILGFPTVRWNGKGIKEAGTVHPVRWIDAYFTAVVARDTASMDSLASFSIDLMKQSATQADAVMYSLVEVFQAYHHSSSDYGDKLIRTMAELRADGDDWCLFVGMGMLETFAALTTDIGYDFNEVLAKNLQLQERYRIEEAGEHRIAVQSFINIPLLGMACMWHDRGNELQVSGPFLPPALVDGRWLDEVKSGRYTR